MVRKNLVIYLISPKSKVQMEIGLLGYPIKTKSVLRQLRQDMKDDWFADAIGYEEILDDEHDLMNILHDVLDNSNGIYRSGSKCVYDVPKRQLGLRYSIEVDFYDRFVYQSIVSYITPYFDPVLSNRVMSHRYKGKVDRRYLFRHPIQLWKNYERISFVAIEDGKYLLVTDLLNYFENISIKHIETAFIGMMSKLSATGEEKNRIRSALETLKVMLEKWCFNDIHGLPQNRDASSFISNVVLDDIDVAMVEAGYDYFRYVDDIRVICDSENEAKQALNFLIRELRKKGMNINSKKTQILNSSSEDLSDFFPSIDDRLVAIDSMWQSKSKKIICKSIPILYDLLVDSLDQGETQSRPFRFSVNRLRTLISTNLFDSSSVLASKISGSLIDQLPVQPVSTDQFCKLLKDLNVSDFEMERVVQYLCDQDQAIYGWQNYHLLLLFSLKKYYSDDLIDYCVDKISNDLAASEVPACFIYLASIGKQDLVEKFIPEFKLEWPYQHQRFFLIALQNSTDETLAPLIERVSLRCKGTIRRLREHPKFKDETTYIRDFTVNTISDLYNEVTHYE